MNGNKNEIEKFVCRTALIRDQDWPKQDAQEFLKWFEGQLKKIPAEYADRAFIQIDCEEVDTGEYERYVPTISISYLRPENPEETEKREKDEKRQEEELERRQYQTWLNLSKKFGKKEMVQSRIPLCGQY